MTDGGLGAFDPDKLSPNTRARIHAGVDDLLSNPTLSDSDAQARIDGILGELFPSTPPAPPPAAPPPPPPVQDWARDHAPLATLDPAPEPPAAAPAGGQVQLPHTNDSETAPTPAQPVTDVPSAPDWDRYGLWSPPKPVDLEVPPDVADVAPVAPPLSPPPAPTIAGDEFSDDIAGYSADTPVAGPFQTRRPGRREAIARGWRSLPPWAKVAIPTAGALALVIALLITLIGVGGDRKPAPPPLSAAAPEQPAPAKPVDAALLPATATADCPPGSSDPTLAFGTDKSQAWICTRLYNVDNSILTITFAQPVVVSSITVVPGFDYVEANGQDHWNEHRLVTQILWRIGGTQIMQSIAPTRAGATLQIPNLATQIITATIMATQPPPATPGLTGSLPGMLGGPSAQKVDDSMAIGHIEILGHPAGGPA